MSMTRIGVTGIVLPSSDPKVTELLSNEGLASVMKSLCGAVVLKDDSRKRAPNSRPKAP